MGLGMSAAACATCISRIGVSLPAKAHHDIHLGMDTAKDTMIGGLSSAAPTMKHLLLAA
jgi:hypothetical protein